MIELSRNYPTLELVERIAGALDIEIYKLFFEPHSPNEELERLRQDIRNDTKLLLDEFLEKTLTGDCKERIASGKVKNLAFSPEFCVRFIVMPSSGPGLSIENAEKSLALASALFPGEEWILKEPGIWVARSRLPEEYRKKRTKAKTKSTLTRL
jgi:transcriptional regulator with XRE-family HTH domain